MTSNQTIDGVPRRVCHTCVGLPRKAYCPVCDDDPAAQPQGEPVAVFEIDTTGYRCRVTLDPSKGLPPNGTNLYAEPQKHGEPVRPAPVAAASPAGVDSISMKGTTIYCNGADNPVAYTMNGVIVNLDGYTLYAPGADPVAVVLPERREPTQDNPYLSDADHEWNAYRDELKRLNDINQ